MMSVPEDKRTTVVVTGVGAIIGQGIIRSLGQCRKPPRIIGVDRNPHSMGPLVCDSFHQKPACEETSQAYHDFWLDLLRREAVDLVLPGLEVDLFYLNAQRELLSATGAVLGLNDPRLIEVTRDKWLFGKELAKAGFQPIPTLVGQDWDKCLGAFGAPPFLLKPRQGNGSRGIVKLFDKADLEYWAGKSGGSFMIQKIVGTDDEEYTAGAFGLGNGDLLAPLIFRRQLSSAGNTQFAEVVQDDCLDAAIRQLCQYFKPIGPTNFQFRKEDGRAYLLEINPRLSSSTSLRAGFGYNEAEMALTFYLERTRPETPVVQAGRAWRYAEDFFQR